MPPWLGAGIGGILKVLVANVKDKLMRQIIPSAKQLEDEACLGVTRVISG